MGLRTGVLFVVVLLIAALAALNWGVLVEPTLMSIGLMQINAPFGLIMLGLTTLLAVFFLAYVIYLQSTVLIDGRRHTKEMQAQRELADRAEASRFTELRGFLEAQEQTRVAQSNQRQAVLLARVEQLEATLRLRADQSDHTTAVLGDVVPTRPF